MGQAIHPGTRPSLRLVRADDGPNLVESQARRAVEHENRRAARLAYTQANDDDVRRVLAMRTADLLEGGRAAILPPHERQDLVKTGHKLGLRPFEANLVIAVVQDAARRGEPVESSRVQRSLEVIPNAARSRDKWNDPWTWARLWLASAAIGGLLLMLLIDWIIAL